MFYFLLRHIIHIIRRIYYILFVFVFWHKTGYAHSGHEYYDVSDEKSSSKEMTLRDIFDIALTTIAFLSFGIFVLQVLMCITMVIFFSGIFSLELCDYYYSIVKT